MASGDDQSNDFYAVLGLKKECSALELRNAYKKLALRWHPDRCSASGNSKFVEEAKKKFQAIQEAYSVLSDENKRFLYDVGVYDCDDDDEDEQGMGEFLGEMAVMMSQTKPCDDGQQSFEDLQMLFEEMFQNDIAAFSSNSQSSHSMSNIDISSTCNSNINSNNKRNCSNLGPDKSKVDRNLESLDLPSFCFGVGDGSENSKRDRGNGRRTGRKQKMSSQEDVASSHGSKISV